MEPQQEKLFWLRKPVVNTLIYILCALCAASILLDLVIHRHEIVSFAEFFGFYGWFGFIACVALVLAAKIMRRVLMRPEDYYDSEDES
ncbi:MAG: hypothetical protein R3352_00940 [Salinisphaeraceae bacterium]|nr:hypothetical protein [Salinisphaeraceae bacterium]